MNWRTYALISASILALSWLIRIGIGYPEVDALHKGAVYLLDCCIFVPMVIEYLKNSPDTGTKRMKNAAMISAFFLFLVAVNILIKTSILADMFMYVAALSGYCYSRSQYKKDTDS